MTAPTISVLMAVYNGERSLARSVKSVLRQTGAEFEFVIVDDASTDATVQCVEAFGDPRVVLVRNTGNIGQTASLNLGLARARGSYVARIDAGDIMLPGRLARQIAYLDRHPQTVVLGTAAVRYDPRGRMLGVVSMPTSRSAMIERALFTAPTIHVSVMMRRQPILALGGYDEQYRILADHELWSRALEEGLEIVNLPDILSGYEVSPSSQGASQLKGRSRDEALAIIKKNAMRFAGRPLSDCEAVELYALLVLDMEGMRVPEIVAASALLRQLMSALGTDARTVEELLAVRYLRLLVQRKVGFAARLYAFQSLCYPRGFSAAYAALLRGLRARGAAAGFRQSQRAGASNTFGGLLS